MTTQIEDWTKIVRTLARAEEERDLELPPIIMARERFSLGDNPPQQAAAVKAMLDQGEHSTKEYRSDHCTPFIWLVRIDQEGGRKVLGLAFVQLELKASTAAGERSAHVRVVSSLRRAGWTLEAAGPCGSWKGAQTILRRFAGSGDRERTRNGERTFFALPEENVEPAIRALVAEADRLHGLITQMWDGS